MHIPTWLDPIQAYARDHLGPPLPVGHPSYGLLGTIEAGRGFVPPHGRWASTRAILRDESRYVIRSLRWAEDRFPSLVMTALVALLMRDPLALPFVLGAITTYDGIVSARGNGNSQDIWMMMTTATGGVTLSWYDCFKQSWTPGAVPSVAAYTNAGTGGAVLDAASNGSWLTNPGGTNKKYIVSTGVTVTSNTGFSLLLCYDALWGGNYSLTSNATINPTTDVAVTRYAGAAAGGNRMMCTLTATLTHTVAPTITTTYTNQAGTTGQTSISIAPATGPVVPRVVFNTVHNSATVVGSAPFMPLTNGGDAGLRNLEQVVVAGGTVSSGAVDCKIVRPLMCLPTISANAYAEQDVTLNIGGMTELVNVSQVCGCVSWCGLTAGTTTATLSAMIRTVEG